MKYTRLTFNVNILQHLKQTYADLLQPFSLANAVSEHLQFNLSFPEEQQF